MKYIYILLITFIINGELNAQNNATLSFFSKENSSVRISTPIDDGYNHVYVQKELDLPKGKSIIYKIKDIKSFENIYVKFNSGKSCIVLLFPNDSVTIYEGENHHIKFMGQNKIGLQYRNDKFRGDSLLNIDAKRNSIFLEYTTGKITLELLMSDYKNIIIKPILNKINNIRKNSTTSSQFLQIMQKDILMGLNSDFSNSLEYVIHNEKFKEVKKDSISIVHNIDSIYQTTAHFSSDLIKYSNRIYILRYISYYKKRFERNVTEDEKEIFGPYLNYLYTSDSIRKALLGNAAMVQLKFNTKEMDLIKVKKYFNEKYPTSEYTAILNMKITNKMDKNSTIDRIIIKEKIDHLSQLKDIDGLQGKYLFIDLWASWCMPCRAEFSYIDDLHKVLSVYKNLETVYISIDNSQQPNPWLGCLEYYKLKNYHLIANKTLRSEIQNLVYGKESMEIPRYFLVSPEGIIINSNLPRPSQSAILKSVLEKIFRK